ncbi:MAG: 23S rRNA (adenine(2503)-C(2))-methyltransferase RlmN [Lentisphaeria bacterium]|nr:23S rRNA (adenine(2503)-C(2))-methyltransferase RlmN [Lentisphaeria bacterium]
MKKLLAGMSHQELADYIQSKNLPRFRAKQITDWMYHKYVWDPAEMSNLAAPFRQELKKDLAAPAGSVETISTAPDGTEKMLIRLQDGNHVELVLIPGDDGRTTFCLSTQVGCPVRCAFCASGAHGLVRNLSCGEIIEEFLFAVQRLGKLPDNIVFMGIGEGLLNFDALSGALTALTSQEGFGMAPRRITVSTSGIVPGIRKLSAMKKEFTLAISLHAVDEETRSRIIPPEFRYPITDILQAADAYREECGRMVTLEYTLLEGINDSLAAAAQLGKISKEHHAKINLIPYNQTDRGFRRPKDKVIRQFMTEVEKAGGCVTCRKERGGSTDAACGQLRDRIEKKQTQQEIDHA